MQSCTKSGICHKSCTGSTYYGNFNDEGKPSGYGHFQFPNGIEYQGQFKDGVFHGHGILMHPTKFKMCGQFAEGKCIDYQLYFADGLEYAENNWKYCQGNDRRFWLETMCGIPPVGEGFRTKGKPSRPIPRGMYDSEEGFFDPVTRCIYDAQTGAKKRLVCPREQMNIMRNCRMNDEDFAEREKKTIVSGISTDSIISID